MKNILISDEEGGILLYAGKVVSESDLDALARILERVEGKMQKLEKHAPTPEGTRLNIIEYSHDVLWKTQTKTNKILREMEPKVALLSKRSDLDRALHTRIYKEINNHGKAIVDLQYSYTEDIEARKRIDKRLTDIEGFLGDL